MTESGSQASSPPAADVGSILKQARLRRGQSFDVVFQHTRIPKKFLDALENNRFDDFPAEVYLQGFLKSYCEHLDLDFDPLWNQVHPPQPKAEAPKETRTPGAPPEPEPAPAKPQPAPALKDFPAALPAAYVFLGAVALAAAVAAVLLWKFPKSAPKTHPPPLAQPIPQAPPPAARPPQKMTLKMTFRNEAWVSLRLDGRLRFEGRGPAGSVQTWAAMKEFALRTSNPEDLSLYLDGSELRLAPAEKNPAGEYLIRRP